MRAFELALVLEAKGLAHDLSEIGDSWVISVAPETAPVATQELSTYITEPKKHRTKIPTITPFPGIAIGAMGYSVILLTTAYCVGMNVLGVDWLSVGALTHYRSPLHEWWRPITALTLHLDQAHLLSNVAFGIGAGSLASALFGPGLAWGGILVAATFANCLEMLVAPPGYRTVGASTAVFAALGLLSGFAWRQRLTLSERWLYRWTPLFAGISLLALLGTGAGASVGAGPDSAPSTEHVDVVGHLLGFSSGIALGWIYARLAIPRTRSWKPQIIAGALATVSIVLAWSAALHQNIPH